MTTDPTGTGAIPQEAVDAICAAMVMRQSPREIAAAALPILRAQWEAEHWSAEFTFSLPCPAGVHPQWAVESDATTVCPACALDEQEADLAAARQQLDAVRARHAPDENGNCSECSFVLAGQVLSPGYPCATLRDIAVAPTDAPVHRTFRTNDGARCFSDCPACAVDAPATKDGETT